MFTLPTVTLSNATSFLVAMVILPPACSTATLSPATKVTVSSGLICSTDVPAAVPLPTLSVVSFQPLLATSLTACNWLPFTASFDVALTSPAVTPVIFPVAASSLIAPD